MSKPTLQEEIDEIKHILGWCVHKHDDCTFFKIPDDENGNTDRTIQWGLLTEAILATIRKHLPEKTPFYSKVRQNTAGKYCGTCEQAWEYCSCSARNTGFDRAISEVQDMLGGK